MIDVRNISSKIFYCVLLVVAITSPPLLSQEPPEEFQFEQSTLQAFYFISSVKVDNELIKDDDWVGAFIGNTCIGAQKWDTSQCGNGICAIGLMGNDGSDYTMGYIIDGEMPSFKIYDSEQETIYDAYPSENYNWFNNQMYWIQELQTGDNYINYCLNLNSGANLVSFYALPEDNSINNIMLELSGNA
jgi:hypothetical protein